MRLTKHLIFTSIVVLLSGCAHACDTCLHTHVEHVYHKEWIQIIYGGKGVAIPIMHPAYDQDENVCDTWEAKNNN